MLLNHPKVGNSLPKWCSTKKELPLFMNLKHKNCLLWKATKDWRPEDWSGFRVEEQNWN